MKRYTHKQNRCKRRLPKRLPEGYMEVFNALYGHPDSRKTSLSSTMKIDDLNAEKMQGASS